MGAGRLVAESRRREPIAPPFMFSVDRNVTGFDIGMEIPIPYDPIPRSYFNTRPSRRMVATSFNYAHTLSIMEESFTPTVITKTIVNPHPAFAADQAYADGRERSNIPRPVPRPFGTLLDMFRARTSGRP